MYRLLIAVFLFVVLATPALAAVPDVYHFDCNDIGLILDAYHPNVTVTIWGEFKDTYRDVSLAYFPVQAGDYNYITWEPWGLGVERDEYHVVSIQSTDGWSIDYSEGPVTCGKAHRAFLSLVMR